MKVTGWRSSNTPAYTHDCKKCKFVESITLSTEAGKAKTVDVYESCVSGGFPYIIRYSSYGSDYCTTDLTALIVYHTIGHLRS